MAEVGGQVSRARLAREAARKVREERDERRRSRSRSRSGQDRRQPTEEGEVKRCRAVTTWSPPSPPPSSASASSASASSTASPSTPTQGPLREQGQDRPVRCRSPHVCRRAEIGGVLFAIPARGTDGSPAEPGQVREGVGERERERMKEV